jgi:hypothetical protein
LPSRNIVPLPEEDQAFVSESTDVPLEHRATISTQRWIRKYAFSRQEGHWRTAVDKIDGVNKLALANTPWRDVLRAVDTTNWMQESMPAMSEAQKQRNIHRKEERRQAEIQR